MKRIKKPQKRGWISVNDSLPRKHMFLIIQNQENQVKDAYYDEDGAFYGACGKVLYWMYYPAPKIEGKKNKNNWKKNKKSFEWFERYLVQYPNGIVRLAYHLMDGGFTLEERYGKVLYWMPLPKPYTEVSA